MHRTKNDLVGARDSENTKIWKWKCAVFCENFRCLDLTRNDILAIAYPYDVF